MSNTSVIETINNNKLLKIIFERILPCLLVAIVAVRLFCYKSEILATISNTKNGPTKYVYVGLGTNILGNNALALLVYLAIWLEYSAVALIILRAFFSFKTIRNLARFVCGPIFILNLALIKFIVKVLEGNDGFTLLTLMLILEASIGLIMSIYYFIKNFKDKNDYKSILFMLGMFLLLMIPALPKYFVQATFGLGNGKMITAYPCGLFIAHRILLYIGVIVPVVMYFLLRNKSQDVIRFTLIYVSITTMVGFLSRYDYTNFKEPWTWPFHLCNTAMFIIPLCLIFKMKRLFYFTYFINVLGAVLAMLMPNYDKMTPILSAHIFEFWYNHWIASFMPLLIVALKVFSRPKIKQFYWSMVWFFVYFVLVLVLNVVFTALGKETDYFFINSDFIGDKLGEWGKQLFELKTTINVVGLTLTFHPLYQLLFFLVYVVLGLCVWFVYNEFFIIADSHYELYLKLKKIKLDKLAMQNAVSPERKEKLMTENREAKFELKHFSKKYATSKVYAVKDANLVVNAGEIFGFLGPNGAGKSTIIKSVVGIQPITEGNIEICGYDVATESVSAKANIGYVPDHYALYEKLTGREYINYIADIYEVPQKDRDERIEKYVKLFELEGSIDSKIRTYSHGMKQKITIMSALVHNPKVWILDEPLTGLDPNSIYQVKECMKQHAAEGNIVFFSSHLIDIVEKLCVRIAIIKKGQIQCVKTVEEIEASGTTLEQFYLDTITGKEDNSHEKDSN